MRRDYLVSITRTKRGGVIIWNRGPQPQLERCTPDTSVVDDVVIEAIRQTLEGER